VQFVRASEQAHCPSNAAWHVSKIARQRGTAFRTAAISRNILTPTIIESEWVGTLNIYRRVLIFFYGHRHLVIVVVVVLDLETCRLQPLNPANRRIVVREFNCGPFGACETNICVSGMVRLLDFAA